MRVSYVRISTNEKGASCFEDCYSDRAPGYAVPPAPPLFSRDFTKAGQCFWIGAPPTWGGQVPHPVPRRQIFVTVSGEYEVSVGRWRHPTVSAGGSTRSRRHDRHGTFDAGCERARRFRFRGHDGRIDRLESLVGPWADLIQCPMFCRYRGEISRHERRNKAACNLTSGLVANAYSRL